MRKMDLKNYQGGQMNNPIENLNKTFDSRVRLGIMSTLMVNDEINFNDLKQLIDVTDGNLASHIKSLEENGFIKVNKGFVGRKTNTTYAVTKAGEKAFQQHLSALEKMIKAMK
jgi:DNA-binding MarR family transcriptional regulator